MKDFLAVFSYTFKENVRKKAFIISTVIILLMTAVVLNIPAAIKYFEGNEKTDEGKSGQQAIKSTVYVIDSKGVFEEDVSLLGQAFTGYSFKLEAENKIEDLKEQVKNGSASAIVIVDEKEGVPCFNYVVKEYGSGIEPGELSRALKGVFASKLLKAANVPDNISGLALKDISYEIEELGKGMMKSYISGMLVIMLLFFAVYFYGYGVSMSVASEKTSRVMELLLTSTKPSRVILGKSAAMGLVGLCQLLLIILTTVLFYYTTFPDDFTIMGQPINFSNFTPFSVVMMIVYFILGYSLYAMMNAVAGATVSKAEDVNSAIMPISMITLVAFYLAYAAIGLPEAGISVVASIVPFSAPFSMPCRILMTEVPLWQIAASLVSMIATIVLMALVSIRFYSSAVLHYGKRLKVADLMKMSKTV